MIGTDINPVPDEIPDEAAQSRYRAAKDLQDIILLKASKPFNDYFLRRLRDRIKTKEERILDDRTTIDDVAVEKAVLREMKSLLRMIEEDEAGCRSILNMSKESLPVPV